VFAPLDPGIIFKRLHTLENACRVRGLLEHTRSSVDLFEGQLCHLPMSVGFRLVSLDFRGRGGLGSAVGTVVQAGRDFREVASAVVDTMTPVVEPLATPLHHLLDKTLFARRLAEDSAHVLLSLGQHVPLIQPICFALKALLVVVQARLTPLPPRLPALVSCYARSPVIFCESQSVRVHKKRVAAFSERVTELSRTIMELAATTRPEQGGGATANMLSSHLDRFKTVLDQCKTTLDVFAGRKFVMRMVMGRRDIETLAQLDNRLTTCITDLQPALQAQVLTIQQVSYSAMTDANAAIMEQLMALQERVGGRLCSRASAPESPSICSCPSMASPERGADGHDRCGNGVANRW
jgi:hypothetical protein